MKKSYILTVIMLTFVLLMVAQQNPPDEVKKTYKLQKAYAYLEEQLLISDTDNYCTFFIRREPIPEDLTVTGGIRQDEMQTLFSTSDQVFINGGSRNGLKEGDMLIIIAKGPLVPNPFGANRLGTHYLKKSLAVVTCLYEDRAIITLKDSCHQVEVGDVVLPFKAEKTLMAKKLIYTLCRIPANPVEGRVIYSELAQGSSAELASMSTYLSVDLGEGLVEKGTFLLFYRVYKESLPSVIIGLGIVIHTESNVSTVKLLDSSVDIRVGDHVVVLSGSNMLKEDKTKKEEIPVVDALNREAEGNKPENEAEKRNSEEKKENANLAENSLQFDLVFDFDSKDLTDAILAELDRIPGFVSGKAEYAVILRGYSCSIGSDKFNLKLSNERVEAVKALLASKYKIDLTRIETYFYGEKESQHDNTVETQRRLNRLVKVEVVGK